MFGFEQTSLADSIASLLKENASLRSTIQASSQQISASLSSSSSALIASIAASSSSASEAALQSELNDEKSKNNLLQQVCARTSKFICETNIKSSLICCCVT
jgi:hypothetical protein